MEFLEDMQKDIASHVESNANIDWKKVREVLATIAAMIDSIAATLPAGVVKTTLMVISSMIKMVISMLPA